MYNFSVAFWSGNYFNSHFINTSLKYSICWQLYKYTGRQDLSVVGKISGVYKKTMANAAEIPNFPIMLNAVLIETSDTLSPAKKKNQSQNVQKTQKTRETIDYWHAQ